MPGGHLKLKKILPGKQFSAGTRAEIEVEPKVDDLPFTVHKFNNRPKPTSPRNIVIFPVFSEFGSEIIASLYCIPFLLRNHYLGKYSIVVGWHGRSYLYKYLVDEFWELDEKYMWLRDYARAFHHDSKNIAKLEKNLRKQGVVSIHNELSWVALKEIFPNLEKYKKIASWPPIPQENPFIESFLQPNLVGITARYRRTWGRNLSLEFYEKLIYLLKNMGFNPIWLGEKATTYDCPVDIPDFRNAPESQHLENTLYLVSKMVFTVQYYTASTRLAGLVGTPFFLCESPDQIYGPLGQEGIRLSLCSRGPKKILISHYKNMMENEEKALELTKQSIEELLEGNYEEKIGLVQDEDVVKYLQQTNRERIGFKI